MAKRSPDSVPVPQPILPLREQPERSRAVPPPIDPELLAQARHRRELKAAELRRQALSVEAEKRGPAVPPPFNREEAEKATRARNAQRARDTRLGSGEPTLFDPSKTEEYVRALEARPEFFTEPPEYNEVEAANTQYRLKELGDIEAIQLRAAGIEAEAAPVRRWKKIIASPEMQQRMEYDRRHKTPEGDVIALASAAMARKGDFSKNYDQAISQYLGTLAKKQQLTRISEEDREFDEAVRQALMLPIKEVLATRIKQLTDQLYIELGDSPVERDDATRNKELEFTSEEIQRAKKLQMALAEKEKQEREAFEAARFEAQPLPPEEAYAVSRETEKWRKARELETELQAERENVALFHAAEEKVNRLATAFQNKYGVDPTGFATEEEARDIRPGGAAGLFSKMRSFFLVPRPNTEAAAAWKAWFQAKQAMPTKPIPVLQGEVEELRGQAEQRAGKGFVETRKAEDHADSARMEALHLFGELNKIYAGQKGYKEYTLKESERVLGEGILQIKERVDAYEAPDQTGQPRLEADLESQLSLARAELRKSEDALKKGDELGAEERVAAAKKRIQDIVKLQREYPAVRAKINAEYTAYLETPHGARTVIDQARRELQNIREQFILGSEGAQAVDAADRFTDLQLQLSAIEDGVEALRNKPGGLADKEDIGQSLAELQNDLYVTFEGQRAVLESRRNRSRSKDVPDIENKFVLPEPVVITPEAQKAWNWRAKEAALKEAGLPPLTPFEQRQIIAKKGDILGEYTFGKFTPYRSADGQYVKAEYDQLLPESANDSPRVRLEKQAEKALYESLIEVADKTEKANMSYDEMLELAKQDPGALTGFDAKSRMETVTKWYQDIQDRVDRENLTKHPDFKGTEAWRKFTMLLYTTNEAFKEKIEKIGAIAKNKQEELFFANADSSSTAPKPERAAPTNKRLKKTTKA